MSKKMVPESNIHRQPSLIFVTVGTTLFPFARLFKVIDFELAVIDAQAKVVVQTGNTDYQWKYKNVKVFKSLSPIKMKELFKVSTHIITHGGFGTMYSIAQHTDTMPLIIARSAEHREHVDNHQKMFLKFIQSKVPKKYHSHFITQNLVGTNVRDYLQKIPQKNILKEKIFNQNKSHILITTINDFIRSKI